MNKSELDAFEDMMKSFKGLLEAAERAKLRLVDGLRKLSKEELIEEFRRWPEDQIVDFCERIALDLEAYEICDAVYIVKREKGIE